MAYTAAKSLLDAARVYDELACDINIIKSIDDVAKMVVNALLEGNKLLFAGNGGSAADSQHMAGEFVSRFMFDRSPLSAVALTTDTSTLTAIANDYGYEQTFSRQVQALARPGDLLFAYSTSGNSENILQALQVARELQVTTVGFSGANGGLMAPFCDQLLRVPSMCVPRIQEGHLLMGHAICEMVEQQLFTTPTQNFR